MDDKKTTFIKISQPYPAWEGHVAFSEDTCIEWRNKFSISSHWRADPEFGEDSRKLLKKLNPPFFPEDETLIWDPGIDPIRSDGSMFISKLVSDQLTLDNGICMGTEFRLIWGNRFSGVVTQVLYRQIKALERNQNSLKIIDKSNKNVELIFAFPNNSPGDSKPVDFSLFDPLNLLSDFFQLIANYNNKKM